MGRNDFLQMIKPPLYVYPEGAMLKRLLTEAPAFREYYDHERSKITREVLWVYNRDLSTNIRCSKLVIEQTGEFAHLIQVKQLVIDPDDGIDAAHELQHALYSELGFPSVGLTALGELIPARFNLSSSLSNMLNDQLANQVLPKYGFDLLAYYDKASEAEQQQLSDLTEEPVHPETRLYWLSFCIKKLLDRELAAGTAEQPGTADRFMAWYKERYPNIYAEATDILAWIKITGFASPDQAKKVFTELIEKFGLTEILWVV